MPKMGELYKVANKEREENNKQRCSEDTFYYSLFIEDMSGDVERTILLTDKEVAKLSPVYLPEQFEKQLVLGRVYTLRTGKKEFNIVRLKGLQGAEDVVSMPSRLIAKALDRAAKHPETTPKKTWLQDMLD